MLHLLQMGPSKVLTTFPLQIQNSWQLSLLELPPCCVPTRNTVTHSSNSSNLYASTVQSRPPQLMLHSCPTHVFKLFIPSLPILYLLPLPPHHSLWLSFYSSCFLSPQTLSGFFDEMLAVFKPGALSCFTFSRPIPLTLSASRNPILIHLPLSRFSALRSDRTHSRSGILFRDVTHASDGVVIFVRQVSSFSELSTPPLFFLRLIPTLIM